MAASGPLLSVVATPIGNLSDVSERMRHTLQNADLIACEDTRVTSKLLRHLGIQRKELVSYYDQKEKERAVRIIERVCKDHLHVALVSDAGTPLVSDPGYILVSLAHQRKVKVEAVPGPSSLTSFLSATGLPCSEFLFIGFLPRTKQSILSAAQDWPRRAPTVIFFESALRLNKSLRVLAEAFPSAQFAIGRELTKLFEEVQKFSNAADMLVWLETKKAIKGEVVAGLSFSSLDISKAVADSSVLSEEDARAFVRKKFRSGAHLKELLNAPELKSLGLKRADLYQFLLSVKESSRSS